MTTDTTNPLFALASSYVNHTSRNVFLTGRAGTGKTTFLRHIKEQTDKNCLIVAPTGVAAINAGGVTAHSLFQLPLGAYIPGTLKGFGMSSSLVTDQHTLFKNMRVSAEKRKLWQEMELLIIDEVSMMRADMLDAIDQILRAYRRQPQSPFGGVQVLFIGDMHQLPPVVGNNEWELLKDYYNSPFFFDSLVAREAPPVVIELKKIYRQTEKGFISILNNIRNNQVDYEDIEALHERYKPDFEPAEDEGYILLTTHNSKADTVNQKRLEALTTKPHYFEAEVTGDFSDKAFPADRILQLKEGSQVMFIKNDKGEVRRYYNGRIGTVKSINAKGITVGFNDGSAPVVLEREIWKNIRYKYDDKKAGVEEEELGSFAQFPIRLAWAITIHKSQGLTFERAIVDAGASFAPGQVYVALSRLTSLNGLVLHSRIEPRAISTDPRVVEFSQTEMPEAQLERELEFEQQQFLADKLLRCFDLTKLRSAMQELNDGYATRQFAERDKAVEWGIAMRNTIAGLDDTAAKFRNELMRLIPVARDDYFNKLHTRIEAAANYFLKGLRENLIVSLKDHFTTFQTKAKTKKYMKELGVLDPLLRQKVQQMEQAMKITIGLVSGRGISDVLHQHVKREDPGQPILRDFEGVIAGKEVDSKIISYEMFKEGRTIEEIASARGMVVGTIEGHLINFIQTGEVKIEQYLSEKKLKDILAVMKEGSSQETGLVKNMLGEGYSYNDIRAVQHHLIYQRQQRGVQA